MNYNIDTLLTELRSTIADLGKGGGSISPSVYDTAQVLRLFPPEDPEPALQWLLSQQKADGGWGSPETPYARDVPTLAAVLALHKYRLMPHAQMAHNTGLDFLQRHANHWVDIPIDELPSATEMVIPYLIEEAATNGIKLSSTAYASVYQLRKLKLNKIARIPLKVGLPPTYSWEALGQPVDSLLPDSSGSIGLSPTATAAWLHHAAQRPDLLEPVSRAKRYLTQATTATGLNIPGVVPHAWPIPGFEIAYSLYVLLATGLLTEPALQDVVDPIINELWLMMARNHGVGFDDNFTPDVDDTAVATAVLQAKSRQVDPFAILQFKNGDHFCTYQHELNPSVLANAHALYGLAFTGERYMAAEKFLLERQRKDGRWLADKWHSSWIYTTLEVILALNQLGYTTEAAKAIETLLQHQHPNGGWGSGQCPNRTETSYALIILSTLRRAGFLHAKGAMALQQGYHWLNSNYGTHRKAEEKLWLAKESYTPYRIDRIYELSALTSIAIERVSI